MKKPLAIILTVCLIVAMFPLGAFTASAAGTSGTTGSCTWTLNGTELTISGNGEMGNYNYWNDNYAPWGTSITKVTIENGVTSIGDHAFHNCTSLTSVTIGNSVINIGNAAFEDCSSLTSINIPDGVTSIGYNAFYNCSSLKSVTIGNSVTSIDEYAFYDCTRLTSITIPDSVTSIGRRAFDNTVWYDNQPDGPVYAGKVFYKYKGECPSSVIIKDGTLGIAGVAFSDCSSLTSITIPNSVKSIGYWAFYYCTRLTSITIPDSVTSIGVRAFDSCSSLTSITIPDSVTSIDFSAFYGCSSLKNVYYKGTYLQKAKINIGSGNDKLKNATWHYTCEETGHIYDNDCDTTCNVCGAVRTVGPHIYDNDIDTTCNICGYVRKIYPAKPKLTSFTDTTISVAMVGGIEYSIDGEKWQTSGTFTGLTAGTRYTVYARYQATADNAPSCASTITVTTDKYEQTAIPGAPTLESRTQNSITLTAVTGCEYSKNGVYWQASPVFTGLYCSTEYTFYQRYAETQTTYAGESSIGAKFSTEKGPASTPSAPTLVSKTDTTVTLRKINGYEYSNDCENWQESNVFTGLNPNTNYFFYQRKAENEQYFASPASDSLIVKTDKSTGRTISGTVNNFGDTSEIINVALYDASGTNKIAETNITGNNAVYNFSGIAAGNYILKISKKNHATKEIPVEVGMQDITQDATIQLKGDLDGNGKANKSDMAFLIS
ncbi:MAG: leucine-rich repeat protein, partial [Clostridiales bacterium]|nr:leucine-rich repeat protein [Candidatus Equinaster intestinalis]